MGHIHTVWDDDPLFVIDPDSRTITKESSTGKNQLMQYDHNSEIFRFKIPATIEGHPVSNCDIRQIHYINSGTGTSVSNRESNVGIYEIPEFTSDIDGSDYLYFDWLVSQNATQLVGDLKFQIKFGCTNPDRPGEIDYMWGSQVYSAVEILPGINNAEIVVTEYTDILTQWKAEIDRSLDEMNEKIDSMGGGSDVDLSEYVKKTDYATDDTGGVVKVATSGNTYGIIINNNKILQIAAATKNDIAPKANQNKPITPANLEYAVEVCTNQDLSSSYTDEQKKLPISTKAVYDEFDTVYQRIGHLYEQLGNVETALDNIITLQTSYIGGDTV